MEEEVASILMSTVRSIVHQASAEAILQRVHVLRNSIVLRMDWNNVHCPLAVSNHLIALLRQEPHDERRQMMAVICDLVFSTLVGHNTYFTHYIHGGPHGAFMAYAGAVPYGPTHEEF
jgi:hypothetical protein